MTHHNDAFVYWSCHGRWKRTYDWSGMEGSPGGTPLHAKTALLLRCSLEHASYRLLSYQQLGKGPRLLCDYSTKTDHWADGQRARLVLHQWTRLAYPARGGFAYLPVSPRSTNWHTNIAPSYSFLPDSRTLYRDLSWR
jgi:hypothetical protein